jgi:hypothetical protein
MSDHLDSVPLEVMEELRDAMRNDAHIGHTVDDRTDAEVMAWFDQGVPGSGADYAQELAREYAQANEPSDDGDSWAPFMQWA